MLNWAEGVGYLASILVFATFCMRTMVPLRVVAICSNLAFIVYSLHGRLYPILILHSVLLPLNVWRTAQMLRLTRRVQQAAKGELSVQWLRPFMKEVRYPAGKVLFRRGDHGDGMYLVVRGILRIEEIGREATAGDFIGEIALFAADHQRTQTVCCATEVTLLSIAAKDLEQICFQKPEVAFFVLRLITSRVSAKRLSVKPLQAELSGTADS